MVFASDFGHTLGQFGIEFRPLGLLILLLLRHEQPDRVLGRKLGDTGEISHAEPFKNLGAGKLAFAQTEWALDPVWQVSGGIWHTGWSGIRQHTGQALGRPILAGAPPPARPHPGWLRG